MRSNVTITNVSWPHFSWPTLYKFRRGSLLSGRKWDICRDRSRAPIIGYYLLSITRVIYTILGVIESKLFSVNRTALIEDHRWRPRHEWVIVGQASIEVGRANAETPGDVRIYSIIDNTV